jgi:hypothetical protein
MDLKSWSRILESALLGQSNNSNEAFRVGDRCISCLVLELASECSGIQLTKWLAATLQTEANTTLVCWYVLSRISGCILSQKVEIVQLVSVLENIPLDLGRVNPGDKVLHISALGQSMIFLMRICIPSD